MAPAAALRAHGKCPRQAGEFLRSSEKGPKARIVSPIKEGERRAAFRGNALTVADLPHVLAVLDAVDHFQEDFFLLLDSSCGFSQSFHPVHMGKTSYRVEADLSSSLSFAPTQV